VLTGGATASGAFQTPEITASGAFTGRNVLGAAASPLANLIRGETVTLSNGTQVVYGGIAGADGIGRLNFDAQGNVQSSAITLDTANVFAASVSAMAAIKFSDTQYVLTASGTEKGVSVWDVSNTGALTHTDILGINDSLWIDGPTAMEVATIGT
jgi:serralysin